MKVVKKIDYNVAVWCNEKMDNARRKECLCFNCKFIKTCDWASELFGLCKDHNLALMITRCPDWGSNK